ncbi:MAG: hypothetical protein ACRENQ_05250, partial [Gemmatimonadaceae bacterium]
MSSPLDLDQETMRRLGHQVADLVAEHLATIRDEPVQHPLDRRTARERVALPVPAPEHGTSFDEIVALLHERI